MFTIQWYKSLAALTTNNTNIAVKTCSGSEGNYNSSYWVGFLQMGAGSGGQSYYANLYTVKTSYGGGVIFGTGSEPPAVDDYNLSGDIVTGIAVSVVLSKSYDDNGAAIEALYTLTNNGAEPKTISEVGLFGQLKSSGGTTNTVLLERTVLDSPVTIEPSGVGQVKYTIHIDYPTA